MTMKLSFSLMALIAANTVPLIGAVFFGWDATLVLALFWIENLIIGAFNLLKMILVAGRKKAFEGFFKSGFFVIHYGLFCVVHGTLLWDILDLGELPETSAFTEGSFMLLELLGEGVSVFVGFLDLFAPFIWLGISALALSHLVSFIENFILRGEIFDLTTSDLMARPYGQIVVMHVGLIAGALAMEKLGSPVWLLVIIVVLKIVIDSAQHKRRHKAASAEKPVIAQD